MQKVLVDRGLIPATEITSPSSPSKRSKSVEKSFTSHRSNDNISTWLLFDFYHDETLRTDLEISQKEALKNSSNTEDRKSMMFLSTDSTIRKFAIFTVKNRWFKSFILITILYSRYLFLSLLIESSLSLSHTHTQHIFILFTILFIHGYTPSLLIIIIQSFKIIIII